MVVGYTASCPLLQCFPVWCVWFTCGLLMHWSLFNRPRVGSEIWYFYQVPRCCQCSWSVDYLLSSRDWQWEVMGIFWGSSLRRLSWPCFACWENLISVLNVQLSLIPVGDWFWNLWMLKSLIYNGIVFAHNLMYIFLYTLNYYANSCYGIENNEKQKSLCTISIDTVFYFFWWLLESMDMEVMDVEDWLYVDLADLLLNIIEPSVD